MRSKLKRLQKCRPSSLFVFGVFFSVYLINEFENWYMLCSIHFDPNSPVKSICQFYDSVHYEVFPRLGFLQLYKVFLIVNWNLSMQFLFSFLCLPYSLLLAHQLYHVYWNGSRESCDQRKIKNQCTKSWIYNVYIGFYNLRKYCLNDYNICGVFYIYLCYLNICRLFHIICAIYKCVDYNGAGVEIAY